MERGVGKDGEFEMSNFYPTPTKDNGEVIDGWYGWRVENWGCKWDMSDVDYDQMDDTVYMDYQTPWGPNIEFWEKIAEEYKDLTISLSYYEGGMCFGGKFEWTDGKLDMNWEITAPDTDMSEDKEGWTEFVYMDYQTPWGPNIEFWEKIAEEYKDLTISLSYYEGGMCFGGKFEWT